MNNLDNSLTLKAGEYLKNYNAGNSPLIKPGKYEINFEEKSVYVSDEKLGTKCVSFYDISKQSK